MTVLLGGQGKLLDVTGPHEQIIPVDSATILPETGVALLHLNERAGFTRYVLPVYLSDWYKYLNILIEFKD